VSIAGSQDLDNAVFLRPEVKIEPLVCGWYVWPQLVAPAQLAMNIKFRFLPLLQSFVANSSVHIAANSDPKFFGGPFVSLTSNDLHRVKQLIDETTQRCSRLMNLAQDLKDLDALLQEKADGYSLNDFYSKLPESLKGLVELVYDINNHPNIRLFEDLLYDEDIDSHTHEILMSPVAERERSFFISTPRLESSENLVFKMKFSDERLDVLASMRTHPRLLDDVARLFDISSEKMALFRSFFTPTAPPLKSCLDYDGDGVRVRYFGHACVLVQTSQISVLFDPMVALERRDDGRLTFDDLPEFIDYVVLTHNHQDHFSPEMLLQLRHRIGRVIVPRNNSGSITDPSMKLILTHLGYSTIDVVDAFDTIPIPDGEIVSLPFTGEHCDLSIYSKQAVLLAVKGRKFMFLADSDGWDSVLYRRLMRRVKSVDALFLGMECDGAPLTWLYEPLLTKPVSRRNNASRRLSGAKCERAWSVLQEIKSPRVYVYAMGQEPWMRYIMGLEYTPESIQLKESDKFIELCTRAGIIAERLFGSRELVFPGDSHATECRTHSPVAATDLVCAS
jgi:L-ascorbate metabolism protein UlaG (beta-lactamase superfamily)